MTNPPLPWLPGSFTLYYCIFPSHDFQFFSCIFCSFMSARVLIPRAQLLVFYSFLILRTLVVSCSKSCLKVRRSSKGDLKVQIALFLLGSSTLNASSRVSTSPYSFKWVNRGKGAFTELAAELPVLLPPTGHRVALWLTSRAEWVQSQVPQPPL